MPIDNAIKTLEDICSDVFQQGSMAADEPYPARFFTFWNPDTHDHKHYDNTASGIVWELDVSFYSTDPLDVYSTIHTAIEALRGAGWVITGAGHAVASDEPTHTGRGFTAVHLEN